MPNNLNIAKEIISKIPERGVLSDSRAPHGVARSGFISIANASLVASTFILIILAFIDLQAVGWGLIIGSIISIVGITALALCRASASAQTDGEIIFNKYMNEKKNICGTSTSARSKHF